MIGNPDTPGFYMVYNKRTKGDHFSRPHFHPNDRYIVILQGTWWVGSGPKFDPDHGTVPMPPGRFVTHYGKQVHWDGAKDEDAVLLIMGEGPATATVAERSRGIETIAARKPSEAKCRRTSIVRRTHVLPFWRAN